MTQNSDRGSLLCKQSCLEVSKISSTWRTQFIMVFSNLDIFLFLILKPNMELVCSRENFVNLLHNTIINLTNLFYVLKDEVIIKWDRSFCNLLWIFFLLLRSCHFCLCCRDPSLFASCDDQKFANVGWLANSYWRRQNSPSFWGMIAFKKTLVHPPSI
jgi:hypothetical protein